MKAIILREFGGVEKLLMTELALPVILEKRQRPEGSEKKKI